MFSRTSVSTYEEGDQCGSAGRARRDGMLWIVISLGRVVCCCGSGGGPQGFWTSRRVRRGVMAAGIGRSTSAGGFPPERRSEGGRRVGEDLDVVGVVEAEGQGEHDLAHLS